METIWTYLHDKLGWVIKPRSSKKTVHLALESEKMNSAQKKRMPERYHVSEKLDGVYALVTVFPTLTGNEVRHWGRSGKAMKNTEVLDAQVASQMLIKWAKPVGVPIIMISEVTSENPLAELSGYLTPSRVNKAEVIPENLRDNFHDMMSVEEFVVGDTYASYMFRRENLERTIGGTELHIVPMLGFMSLDEANRYAKEIIYPEGKEGLICRANTPWLSGSRNETLVKIKEKLSFDVTVVGMSSGKEGSKYENTLGKLVVVFSAYNKSDMSVLFEIPISGMTDKQRDEWWANPELIIGKTVKMDAKSYTATGNLREPRFKEVRNDKDSDFPVTVNIGKMTHYVKGKATWKLWDWEHYAH